MRRAKYIVGEVASDLFTVEAAIVFPETIAHAAMARRVLVEGTATSAGFFYINDEGGVTVYGRSDSLNVGPAEHDKLLISQALGMETM